MCDLVFMPESLFSIDGLGFEEVKSLVARLLEELATYKAENLVSREANAALRAEIAALRDEIARLKGLSFGRLRMRRPA